MMVELDDNTFCNNICTNMMCGGNPCDMEICQSQCNVSLDSKMSMYDKFESSSSESSEEAMNDEDKAYVEQGNDDKERHHHHHRHGRHHHSRSGDRHRHHHHGHGFGRRFKHKFGFH